MEKHLLITYFDGDVNLGLHGFATDKYCLIGTDRYGAKIKDVLRVKIHPFKLLEMDLMRIFCKGNSSGIVAPRFLRGYDDTLEKIKEHIEVLTVDTQFSSVGNLVLMNDTGIIISPMIKKHKTAMEKFFGLQAEVSTIAGQNLVGNLGFATNKGCLTHPKLREKEKRLIEKTLGVTVDIGTVNFGSPYPGAGLIANSNGFIASGACSGPELGRITDVLGFLDS